MDLSPIDRVYAHIPVAVVLPDGSPAVPETLAVAFLPRRATPTAATAWATVTYTPYDVPDAKGYTGEAAILVAGPEADPTDALPVPVGGAELWARVTDTPEVQAVRVGFISVC